MRIIVGITGASGVIMGYHLLRTLKEVEDCEVHLVVSDAGMMNWSIETDMDFSTLTELADVVHAPQDMAASISSGSFETDGMIIMPCSMKTLAGIVSGFADGLICRAADVCLKEGRKVIMVPREMPLNKIHLRNMTEAANAGCIIVPPVLTFYNQPETLEDQINHVIGKVLMQFHIKPEVFKPWKE